MQLSLLCIRVMQAKVSPSVSHLVCKSLCETKKVTASLLKVFTRSKVVRELDRMEISRGQSRKGSQSAQSAAVPQITEQIRPWASLCFQSADPGAAGT